MKKTIAFASAVCAFACVLNALADDAVPPYYLEWFDAVGASATADNLDPSNGTWTVGTGTKTFDADAGFSFELDADQVVLFTPEQNAAPDTGTVTRVEVMSYFPPIVCAAASELPSASDMRGASAQIGFAAVAVTNEAYEATFSYYAWVGGDNWIQLTGATPNDEDEVATTLVADFDYRGATPTVTFSIVTNGAENVAITNVLNSGEAVEITSTAASSAQQIAHVRCDGNGNIKSLSASIAQAIAEMGGKKYLSLAEVVAAVSTAADRTITMLAETPEDVTLTDGATITNANGYVTGKITAGEGSTVTIALGADDIDGGRSGSYEVPVKTAVSGGGSFVVTIPYTNKEIATNEQGQAILTLDANSIKVTIQTATSVLANVKPDTANTDKTIKATATNGGYTNNAFRVFLAKYVPDAYTNANASAETIADALQNIPTDSNGLKLWQDYVLGIEPTDSVKPLSPVAGDGDSENIKLEIPDLAGATSSGDYTVTYKVYKDGTEVTGVEQQSADAIRIPTSGGTGTYTVRVVLTPVE